ncbi:multicopper oxidase family protein [Quadrisphaera sp. DSM 44207]|uniref:multicopper oxidase family protein n=1 Tax=Quadrisphaera sp. DSM 44207 TaxID=1881057 RepID=UPI000884BC7B|nr:multicopper oxidase family protein [Quadrisphaera sp. DSM 44207]SDQ71836.1 Multicopper oxidase with three cupredoxin domains (includes cell division protein FtsP and spore coat protein CotA) [Quadrisphaera sp. DSM 44207]
MSLKRRDLLKLGGVAGLGGAAVLAVPPRAVSATSVSSLPPASFPERYAVDLALPPVRSGSSVSLTARAGTAQVLPGGLGTPVQGYDGGFPGPTLEVERGKASSVELRNHLPLTGPFGGPNELSLHLHGSASLPEFDGYASDVVRVGQKKTYQYPNHQHARTLWYHDHGMHWTAQNVYSGLLGLYVVHDDEERALLPQGEFDVPLLVSDAVFAADGSLVLDDNDHSGLWGDVILVNGRPWPRMTVKRRTYRFRILDCSIARSYTWCLSHAALQLQVVATDGGLVPTGTGVTSLRHGGAERYEVVVDFSKLPADVTSVELLNGSNANNVDYDFTDRVMRFDVSDEPVDTTDPTWNADYVGSTLGTSHPVMALPTSGGYLRRSFRVEREGGVWTFGGDTWQDVVDSGYRKTIADVESGATEVWSIENRSGGWFHPVHLHLVDFRIIGRTGGAGRVFDHEQGPKDVVYVGEGETVDLLIRFDPSPGSVGGHYMAHCHNLPHEDHDMMAQFSVGERDVDASPHHPVRAAPAVDDDGYTGPRPAAAGTTPAPAADPSTGTTGTSSTAAATEAAVHH